MSHPKRKGFCISGQKCVDIKLPWEEKLAQQVLQLFTYLKGLRLVRAEKFTGDLIPQSLDPDGVLTALLHGRSLSSEDSGFEARPGVPTVSNTIQVVLSLLLNEPMEFTVDVRRIFTNVRGTEISDGGNPLNMALNIALLGTALRERFPDEVSDEDVHVMLFCSREPKDKGGTTSDALADADPFMLVPEDILPRIVPRCSVVGINLGNRFAIQFPMGDGDRFSITSPPARNEEAMRELLTSDAETREIISKAACFAFSDPMIEFLFRVTHRHPELGLPVLLANASTAHRPAISAEAARGPAILAHNDGEAIGALRVMEASAMQMELENVPDHDFPVPIRPDGAGADLAALATLDQTILDYMMVNPLLRRPGRMTFDMPITFGPNGGLLIGANPKQRYYAVFTSVPSGDQAHELLASFIDERHSLGPDDKLNQVGAGDSSASMPLFFNGVDPEFLIKRFLHGDQGQRSDLVELASTIFVSVMARVAGHLLLRTSLTFMANIRNDKLGDLMELVAEEAVTCADVMVNSLKQAPFQVIDKLGVKVLAFIPGTIPTAEGASTVTE